MDLLYQLLVVTLISRNRSELLELFVNGENVLLDASRRRQFFVVDEQGHAGSHRPKIAENICNPKLEVIAGLHLRYLTGVAAKLLGHLFLRDPFFKSQTQKRGDNRTLPHFSLYVLLDFWVVSEETGNLSGSLELLLHNNYFYANLFAIGQLSAALASLLNELLHHLLRLVDIPRLRLLSPNSQDMDNVTGLVKGYVKA